MTTDQREGAEGATLGEGRGGLPRVALAHPSGSRAEVYLHGAHVTSWTPAGGGDLLFVSERSRWQADRAIRGGIPVVFPQFADRGPLPKHGFARTAVWEVATMGWEGDAVAARLVLRDSEATRALWPHAFEAELAVVLRDTLEVTLAVTSRDTQPFAFTAALHSYFRVDEVSAAVVEGLGGVEFIDKTRDGERRTQDGATLRIGGETDRVYVDAPGPVRLLRAAGGRTLALERRGFPDLVVWNPWVEGARGLDDMADEEYRRMLCAEAAVVERPVELGPGESWRATQVLSVG